MCHSLFYHQDYIGLPLRGRGWWWILAGVICFLHTEPVAAGCGDYVRMEHPQHHLSTNVRDAGDIRRDGQTESDWSKSTPMDKSLPRPQCPGGQCQQAPQIPHLPPATPSVTGRLEQWAIVDFSRTVVQSPSRWLPLETQLLLESMVEETLERPPRETSVG